MTELEKLERDYAIVKTRGARSRLLEMMEEEIAALRAKAGAGEPAAGEVESLTDEEFPF